MPICNEGTLKLPSDFCEEKNEDIYRNLHHLHGECTYLYVNAEI